MEIDELLWNFNSFSIKNKFDFLLKAEKEVSLEIVNEVLDNRPEFGLQLSMVGVLAGYSGAFLFWKNYWNLENPDYASVAAYQLFIDELAFRTSQEEKFRKELEAM